MGINDNMFILAPENIMRNNSKYFIGEKKHHLYCDKFNIEIKGGLNIRTPDFV